MNCFGGKKTKSVTTDQQLTTEQINGYVTTYLGVINVCTSFHVDYMDHVPIVKTLLYL